MAGMTPQQFQAWLEEGERLGRLRGRVTDDGLPVEPDGLPTPQPLPGEGLEGVVVTDDSGAISLDEFKAAQSEMLAAPAPGGGQSADPTAGLPRNAAADQGGVWNWVTGDSRREFDIPELAPDLGAQMASSLAFDDEGKQGILGKMMADQNPTFTQDKFGNSVVTFGAGPNKGQSFYVNRPGFSMQDATTLGTNIAMTAIPGGLAARGAVGLGLRGVTAVGGSAALGAMAGETARQAGGNALGDETRANNLIPGVDLPELAMAGLGEGVPTGVAFDITNQMRPRGTPVDIDQRIAQAADLSDATGARFTRGQVLNTRDATTRMNNLTGFRETSGVMDNFLREQDATAQRLADDFIGNSAAPSPVLLETEAKSAAESVIKSAKESRKAQGDPLFTAALDGKPDIDTTPLVSQLETLSKTTVKGVPFGNKLKSTIDILKADDDWLLNPRQIQSVRLSISDAIKEAERAGNNNLAKQLIDVEDQMTAFLDLNAAGYKQANDVWKQLSVPVKELQDSAINDLAKLDQFGLERFAERVFGRSSTARQREFVKQNLDKVDPQTYRRLAQSELERRMSLLDDTELASGPRNIPQQINKALFRNPKEREMWKQAFPDMADQIDQLHEVLNIFTRGRATGSNTVDKARDAAEMSSRLDNIRADNGTTFLGFLKQVPAWMARKSLGSVGEARTAAKREAALAKELDNDFAAMADEFAEKVGRTNTPQGRTVSAFLQSLRQFAGSDPMPTEEPAQAGTGILTE